MKEDNLRQIVNIKHQYEVLKCNYSAELGMFMVFNKVLLLVFVHL